MNKDTQKELLNLVKTGYEQIAEEFNETRKKFLWSELVRLAGMVEDGDSVLDAGCGNGRLLEALKEKKINYLGVDNSGKLIELAKINGSKFSVPNFRFQVADILELDKLNSEKFDHVFCIAVLQHIPGKDLQIEALRQMKNKLKSGGKIILSNWNLWSQKKIRTRIIKFALKKIFARSKMDFGDVLFDWKNSRGEPVAKRYYHAFTGRSLYKVIKKAGFKKINIYRDMYNYYAILE